MTALEVGIVCGVITVQMVGGGLLWLLVRRRHAMTWTELGGMAVALGTFLSMTSAMLLAGTPVADWSWALPSAVVAIAAAAAVIRGALRGTRVTAPAAQWIGAAAGIVGGATIVALNWNRVPLSDPVSTRAPDLAFFEALSRGLAEFGPSESILMVGGQLRYHWFAYGWAGEVTQVSGAPAFTVLTRILPLVAVVGCTLLASAWAGAMSRVRWVPALSALLVVVAGYAGALYGSILNFDSPSQSMATVWLLALSVAVMQALRDNRVLSLAVVALLASATTGGKVSHGAVAGAGVVALAAVALVFRQDRRGRTVAVAATAALSILATYVVVIAGAAVDRNLTEVLAVKASTWQGLDPIAGSWGVVLGTAVLVLAILARIAGLGPLLMSPAWRSRPEVVYSLGAVIAGLLALLVLRDGINELWFVLAASAPAAVVSAVGSGVGLAALRQPTGVLRRPLVGALIIAVPSSLVCLVLSRNWSNATQILNWLAPVSAWVLAFALAAAVTRGRLGRRTIAVLALSALPLVAVGTRVQSAWTTTRPVTTETGVVNPAGGTSVASVSASNEPASPAPTYSAIAAAAAWMNSTIPGDAVVATNNAVSSIVPALSGRRMFVAGILYQIGLGRPSDADVAVERGEVSGRLAGPLDDAQRAALCNAGVGWLWLETDSGQALGSDAIAEYSTEGITILRLTERACS